MAMFPFAARGVDKAIAGLAAYTLFVLLETRLGTVGCLAAEAVIICAVLLHSRKLPGKEVPLFQDSEVAQVETPNDASGDDSQANAATKDSRRGDSARGGRPQVMPPAEQPLGGQITRAASPLPKDGGGAPQAIPPLRPSAGSWAAQAAQRRKQEEAGGSAGAGGRAALASPKSSAVTSPQAHPPDAASTTTAPALKPSAGSWAAQQRKKREDASSGETTDSEFTRNVKSILNKLTVEKFDALYGKLIACGIRTPAHVEILVSEIVEKARAQHHFVKMYAELCVRLEGEFATVDDCNFKRILLDQCQKSFESCLKPLPLSDQGDEAGEAQAKHKERMLGNIKLTGELLMRQMLSSKILVACAEDLLQEPPAADRLECLAVLLQVTGATFDNPAWTQHESLSAVFASVTGLSQERSVPSRVRCLLQDVLDLRAASWIDSRAVTRVEGPKRLDEVQKDAEAESLFVEKPKREWEPRAEVGRAAGANLPSHAGPPDRSGHVRGIAPHEESWRARPPQQERPAPALTRQQAGAACKRPSNPKLCKDGRNCTRSNCWFEHPEGKLMDEAPKAKLCRDGRNCTRQNCWFEHPEGKLVDEGFDLAHFHHELSVSMRELAADHDGAAAVRRFRALRLPVQHHAAEFCNLLTRAAEEPSGSVRRICFAVAASLAEGALSKPACCKGAEQFFEEIYPSLCEEVPGLPEILGAELIPTLRSSLPGRTIEVFRNRLSPRSAGGGG